MNNRHFIYANGVDLEFNELNDGVFVCMVDREKMLALREYKHPVMEQSVWDLGLSVRAANVLRSDGIETIGQLVEQLRRSPYCLFKIPNCGKVTQREIKDALRRKGLSWGEGA